MTTLFAPRSKIKRALTLLGGALLPLFAEAQPPCQEAKSARELYVCSIGNHPHQALRAQTKAAADALVSQSRRFDNPTLDVKSVTGNIAGESQGSTEVSVSLPISSYLVGRSAKIEQAEADARRLQTEFEEEIFTIKSALIKDLYRLRQAADEFVMVEEALAMFSSVERQLRSRPARGPEQEITLNLVTLVQGDYELKKNRLTTEKSEILSRLKVIWGEGFRLNAKLLPAFRQTWPEVEGKLKMDTHFELRKAQIELEKATADKNAAIAQSWPKVSIGPTVERQTTGGAVAYSYGLNFGMDIPIFSINSGGRQVAEASRLRSQMVHELVVRKVQVENEITVNKYLAAVDSLKRSSSRESLVKNHTRIDSLFRQGLAAGTVIVEAHRQMLEFTLSRHEHELTAIDALINLYQLQGKDLVEVLP